MRDVALPTIRNLDSFCHILPVPSRSFNTLLYVTNIGWERIEPRQQYPVNKAALYMFNWDDGRILPEFCLAYCADGSGAIETRNAREKIRAGEACLYRPGEWHRHRPTRTEGWTLLWVGFNGDLPHRWMSDDAYQLKGNKPMIEQKLLFEAQFERLLLTSSRNPTRNSEEISWQTIGLLSHFLVDQRQEPATRSTGMNAIVNLALEYIWNHTHSAIGVTDVANHVGCSRRTLETRFKEATERTVLEEIQACRTERAVHLLDSTDIPIKQVVYRSGFQSHEQMRLALKRSLGKTPSEIRNR